MLVLRHLQGIRSRFVKPVLTLGNFDGVHLGHQAILHRVAERAAQLGGTPVALTFDPHPIAVLAPQRAPALLTDLRTRLQLIASSGVDNLIVQRFTATFAKLDAPTFVCRLLVDGLRVAAVVVGHRVRFGHARLGDAALLERLGREYGFTVEVIGPIEVAGHSISSSAIRAAVGEGDLESARACLGRPHVVCGRVVQGHQRGRGLGFPTANVRFGGQVLPPDGVYAVRTCIGGDWKPGVANIGSNPTFRDAQRGLEVHVLDFDDDLYGRRLAVAFAARLRGEIKFPNPQVLVEQIRTDVATARRLLAGPG